MCQIVAQKLYFFIVSGVRTSSCLLNVAHNSKMEYTLYLVSASVQTEPVLRANGTSQGASKAQVTGTFCCFMIGSAMIEPVQKHAEHNYSALLFYAVSLVLSACSVCYVCI